jgi:hypothetical protein
MLDTLEKLAREATPGPWRTDPHALAVYGAERSVATLYTKSGAITGHERNAPYIAAADPATVLKMIAAIRAAAEHVESMDNYEHGDLVPMNRTRGTTAALRDALAALEDKK